jgi:lipid-binding SYLF domain-containing protein
VYVKGQVVGEATMNQLTAGAQVGGQAYSQIVFFQDERSFKEFTNGNFEFGAEASAIAITAAAGIKGNTGGSSASASGGKNDAKTAGKYNKGMAIFTVAKGGIMYEASVGGQKFKYTAKK